MEACHSVEKRVQLADGCTYYGRVMRVIHGLTLTASHPLVCVDIFPNNVLTGHAIMLKFLGIVNLIEVFQVLKLQSCTFFF